MMVFRTITNILFAFTEFFYKPLLVGTKQKKQPLILQ
jgi:hypothetical protein